MAPSGEDARVARAFDDYLKAEGDGIPAAQFLAGQDPAIRDALAAMIDDHRDLRASGAQDATGAVVERISQRREGHHRYDKDRTGHATLPLRVGAA